MILFITSLAPTMILIIIGFCLKRAKFFPDLAWSSMEKLTYFILFPALLIRTLATQSLGDTPWPSMLLTVAGTITTSAIFLIIFRKVISNSNAAFTSVFQGGVRFNTYIMLAVSQSLYGAAGLAMGSVAAGFMIVLINLWCVSIFLIWGEKQYKGVLPFVRELMGNPLIIGCIIGWSLSLSDIELPNIIGEILQILGRAALPLGLLAVGAALKPEALLGHITPIATSSIAQFGLKPLVTAILIHFTGLTGIAAAVLTIAFMTPTAPSAYILARQLGGDTHTMASIITFQTLLAFLIMPLLSMILIDH